MGASKVLDRKRITMAFGLSALRFIVAVASCLALAPAFAVWFVVSHVASPIRNRFKTIVRPPRFFED